MPGRALQQTDKLLEILHGAGVPFVVVGGVAAIAHGAATSTKDLDIVMSMRVEDMRRLMDVLAPFHPMHATRLDLGIIQQSPEELSAFRVLLIDTDLGRLDVLRRVEPVGELEALDTVEMELIEGRRVRVLTLDQLIEVKAHTGRRKDLIVEQELRAIRAIRGAREP